MYNQNLAGGEVAQLGERGTRTAEVGGSNPLFSTIFVWLDYKNWVWQKVASPQGFASKLKAWVTFCCVSLPFSL